MIFQNPNGDKVGKNPVDKDNHIPGEPNIIYEKQNDGLKLTIFQNISF